MKKIFSIMLIAFLAVSLFVSCSQESTIENIYLGENATITFDLGAGEATGTAPRKILSNKGSVITLPSTVYATLTNFTFDGWTDGSATYTKGASYTVNGSVNLEARWKTTVSFATDSNCPTSYHPTPSNITVYYGEQLGNLPPLPKSERAFETYVWKNGDQIFTSDTIVTAAMGNLTLTATTTPYYAIKYYDVNETSITDAPVDYVLHGNALPELAKIEKVNNNINETYDTWMLTTGTNGLVVEKDTPFTSFSDYIDNENHELKLYGAKKKLITLVFAIEKEGFSSSFRVVDISDTANLPKYLSATDINGIDLPTTSFSNFNEYIESWYVYRGGVETEITSATVISDTDTIVYAKLNRKVYTVRYDKNTTDTDATGTTMTDQFFVPGIGAKLADCTYGRTGYTFGGWVTTNTDDTLFTSDTIYTSGSSCDDVVRYASATDECNLITLYAHWKANKYVITYTNWVDGTHTNLNYYYFSSPTDGIALQDASKKDLIFKGWYENDTRVTTIVTTSTNGHEYEARWFDYTTGANFACVTTETELVGKLAPTTSTDGKGIPVHLEYAYIVSGTDIPVQIYTTSTTWSDTYVDATTTSWTNAADGKLVNYVWFYDTFTISFNDNIKYLSGTDMLSKNTTKTDQVIVRKTTSFNLDKTSFTDAGHCFRYWSTTSTNEGDYTSYTDGENVRISATDFNVGHNGKVTLYAHWAPKKVTIVGYQDVDKTTMTNVSPTNHTYTYGDVVSVPENLPTTTTNGPIYGYLQSHLIGNTDFANGGLFLTKSGDHFSWIHSVVNADDVFVCDIGGKDSWNTPTNVTLQAVDKEIEVHFYTDDTQRIEITTASDIMPMFTQISDINGYFTTKTDLDDGEEIRAYAYNRYGALERIYFLPYRPGDNPKVDVYLKVYDSNN